MNRPNNCWGSNWLGTLVHDGWSGVRPLYAGVSPSAVRAALGGSVLVARNCSKRPCVARRCDCLGARCSAARSIGPRHASSMAWSSTPPATSWPCKGLVLSCELEQVTSGRFRIRTESPLGPAHLLKHAMEVGILVSMIDPTIAATNHWAEQAIRPAVVNRKVWGGNRTWLECSGTGDLDVGDPHLRSTLRRPVRLPDRCPLQPATATHPRVRR